MNLIQKGLKEKHSVSRKGKEDERGQVETDIPDEDIMESNLRRISNAIDI